MIFTQFNIRNNGGYLLYLVSVHRFCTSSRNSREHSDDGIHSGSFSPTKNSQPIPVVSLMQGDIG